MEIRKAVPSDLEAMLALYADARRFMAEHGNPRQWGLLGWPPADLVRRDIAQGKGYVCTEGEQIIGVFYFDQGHRIDPTYAYIEDGAWIGDENYGVVHRIVSARKGVGSFCIRWALEQCGHLRIDTHGDNVPMQNLLHKLGFTRCGVIYVGVDSDPRIAFERVI